MTQATSPSPQKKYLEASREDRAQTRREPEPRTRSLSESLTENVEKGYKQNPPKPATPQTTEDDGPEHGVKLKETKIRSLSESLTKKSEKQSRETTPDTIIINDEDELKQEEISLKLPKDVEETAQKALSRNSISKSNSRTSSDSDSILNPKGTTDPGPVLIPKAKEAPKKSEVSSQKTEVPKRVERVDSLSSSEPSEPSENGRLRLAKNEIPISAQEKETSLDLISKIKKLPNPVLAFAVGCFLGILITSLVVLLAFSPPLVLAAVYICSIGIGTGLLFMGLWYLISYIINHPENKSSEYLASYLVDDTGL